MVGTQGVVSRYPLLRLDIPTIVETGTGDDFARLVELTQSRCSWLKDICADLDPLVKKVDDFCRSPSRERVPQFEKESIELIDDVFGTHLLIEAAMKNAMGGSSLISLTLEWLIDTLPERSQLGEKSRAIWDILVDSLRESMFDLIEETEDKPEDNHLQDIRESMENALWKASGNSLRRYHSTLDEEGASRQCATNIMKARLHRAIDTFVKSISALLELIMSANDGSVIVDMDLARAKTSEYDCADAFEELFQ